MLFERLDKALPFYHWIYQLVLLLCKIILIVVILATSFAVLGRYIPQIPNPVWTEELVVTAMAYLAVLSASLAIRKRSHIKMSAFDRFLPKKMIVITDIIADLAVLALAIIFIRYGWAFAVRMGSFARFTSLPITRFWTHFPIPLAGVFMIIFEIESLYLNVKRFCGREKVLVEIEGIEVRESGVGEI